MQIRFRWWALFAALLLSAGCENLTPRPEGANPAALGLSMQWLGKFFGWSASKPQNVHLVRWNGQGAVTTQARVLTTNFHQDGRAYLLNARPGRYAVIAVSEVIAQHRPHDDPIALAGMPAVVPRTALFSGNIHFLSRRVEEDSHFTEEQFLVETTYLSAGMIRETLTRVPQGRFTFMGAMAVKADTGISREDAAVLHFYPLKNPPLLDDEGMIVFPDYQWDYRATSLDVNRGKNAETGFLTHALADLKGSGWEPAVRRALEVLAGRGERGDRGRAGGGGPPYLAPPMEGGVVKRSIISRSWVFNNSVRSKPMVSDIFFSRTWERSTKSLM